MTDNTIFDQEVSSPEDTPETYFDRLVGEGKKFKDNESLARGKWEADQTVAARERELQELRTELNKRLNVEELVNKLGKSASSTPVTPTVPESHETPTPTVMPTTVVDPNEIVNLVKNTMTQEQTKLQQEKNLNAVASQLKKVWGDDWVTKLRNVGRSLDLTEAQMDVMAKTSPKALLQAVMPVQNKVDNVSPPRSSIMGIPQQPQESGWAKYEQMRRSDPRRYYSPQVQLQLERDVRAGKVQLPSE